MDYYGDFKEMRRSKRKALFCIVIMSVLLLGSLFSGCGSSGNLRASSSGAAGGEQLEVHFLDVGQADCILIRTGSNAMLVDAGKNEDGEQVVSYLQEQGITRLDYVIGTHPHEDHIGGLDNVIRSFEIGQVILPGKTHTSVTYMDVLQAVEDKGVKLTEAAAGQQYTLGGAAFTVLSPGEGADYGDDLNNWSVGIRLVFGENCFVMTGDAESAAEKDILDTGLALGADVWKAGHHGSRTSNSEAILEAVRPEYAVISCGQNNSYGHPDQEVLNRFTELGIQVFRTDQEGSIVAVSDGKEITWSTSLDVGDSSSSPGPREPGQRGQKDGAAAESDGTDITVHITENGTKYHREGCRYLEKSDIPVSLEEAEARGLKPCGVCNPPS